MHSFCLFTITSDPIAHLDSQNPTKSNFLNADQTIISYQSNEIEPLQNEEQQFRGRVKQKNFLEKYAIAFGEFVFHILKVKVKPSEEISMPLRPRRSRH